MTLIPGQRITYRTPGTRKLVSAVVVSDRPRAVGIGMHNLMAWDVRRDKPTRRGG